MNSPKHNYRRTAAEPGSARGRSAGSDLTHLTGLTNLTSPKCAFSLLEFIGVLGIIALIVAALVPAVIKRIDRAAWVKENANLAAFADAFVNYSLKSNNIPNEYTWSQVVGTQLGVAPADVATNSRRYARAFLIDGGGWLSTNLNGLSAGSPPPGWNQGPGGTTTAPGGARLLIVSSLAGSLNSSFFNFLSGGARPSAAVFSNIWSTPQGSKPADASFSGYKGTGEDLLIQRINLRPLFHRIILVNDDIGTPPYFTIDGAVYPVGVTNGTGWTSYYLDGTVLGLCDTNAAGPTLTAEEVVRKDISRVFEIGYWRDEIGIGPHRVGLTDPTTIMAYFFGAPSPPNPKWGTSTKGVANALSAFMFGYSAWANQTISGTNACFTYGGQQGGQNQDPEYNLIQAALGCFTGNNGGARLVLYP